MQPLRDLALASIPLPQLWSNYDLFEGGLRDVLFDQAKDRITLDGLLSANLLNYGLDSKLFMAALANDNIDLDPLYINDFLSLIVNILSATDFYITIDKKIIVWDKVGPVYRLFEYHQPSLTILSLIEAVEITSSFGKFMREMLTMIGQDNLTSYFIIEREYEIINPTIRETLAVFYTKPEIRGTVDSIIENLTGETLGYIYQERDFDLSIDLFKRLTLTTSIVGNCLTCYHQSTPHQIYFFHPDDTPLILTIFALNTEMWEYKDNISTSFD